MHFNQSVYLTNQKNQTTTKKHFFLQTVCACDIQVSGWKPALCRLFMIPVSFYCFNILGWRVCRKSMKEMRAIVAIREFECPKKYRHLWKYVAYAKRKICILHELRTVIWTAIYAERIVFDVKLVWMAKYYICSASHTIDKRIIFR